MNLSQSPISDPDRLQEAVTAYLDGELDEEAARQIEDRLAQDAPFRAQLQRLQQCWDLLDELPPVEADPNFAATTVGMVAVTGREDTGRQTPGRGSTWLRPAGLLIGATLAACLVGFLVTTNLAALLKSSGIIADADQQMLRDLPLLQQLDMYLAAEDLQFLRTLHAQTPPVIAGLVVDADQRDVLADQPIKRRRARVEQMSPGERNALAVNQQRFAALAPKQQARLRTFYRQLLQEEQQNELIGTLDAFYRWYKLLAPEERAALRGLSSQQRFDYLNHLLAKQERRRQSDVAWRDARATVRWLQEMAVRSRVELTREMPPPARQMLDDVGQPGVRQRLTRLLWQRWQRGGHPVSPALTDQDIARLRESLSPQGRRLLEEAPDIRKALRKLVGKGLESSRRPPLAGHQEGHDSSRPWSAERMFSAFAENPAMQPVLSDEALLGFFREQLDRDQQERLKRLPPDQFLRVLRQEYYRSQFGGPQPHDMMPRGRRPHPPPPSLWRHGSTDGFHRPPSDDARRHKAINPPPEAWPSDQVPEGR